MDHTTTDIYPDIRQQDIRQQDIRQQDIRQQDIRQQDIRQQDIRPGISGNSRETRNTPMDTSINTMTSSKVDHNALEPINLAFIDRTQFIPDFLEIRYSSIDGAGLGIFAKQPIAKGTFLGNYVGKPIPLNKSVDHELSTNVYLFHTVVNQEHVILDARRLEDSNWTRFMNCSCGAHTDNVLAIRCENTGIYQKSNNTYICLHGKIMLYTSRDIQIGEELFFDYGPSYKKKWGMHE
jgi:hypothetical protein